ncbi:MAG: hypothetical protein FWD69_17845, partial [Polyangiaceae bacterium]|nr:hypothetical protein [Polyangiaceae bacterium]
MRLHPFGLPTFAAMMVVVSLVCTPARAQNHKEEDLRKAQAKVLFDDAVHFHDKKMAAEALEKFERAYALYPSSITLFNIACQEHILGKRLKALRHYREAMRNPLATSRIVEPGKEFVAELEPSFARLDLTGPADLVVSLGSEEVTLPLPEPLDIEPGTVTATSESNGQRYEGSGTAVAGQVLKIEMKAPPPSPTALSVVPPPMEETQTHSTRYVVSGSLLAAGLVGVGLGIGFTVGANHAASDVTRLSTGLPYACSQGTAGNCDSLKKS